MTAGELKSQGQPVPDLAKDFVESDLIDWDYEDWDGLLKIIEDTNEGLLRNDANSVMTAALEERSNQQSQEDSADAWSVDCRKKLEKLCMHIDAFKAVSFIRKDITEAIENGALENSSEVDVDPEQLQKTWNYANEITNYKSVTNAIMSIFEPQNSKDDELFLKNVGDLRSIMANRPFAIEHFFEKMERLFKLWEDRTFDTPCLNAKYLGETQETASVSTEATGIAVSRQTTTNGRSTLAVGVSPAKNGAIRPTPGNQAIHQLRRAREELRKEGEDPLHESIQMASGLSQVKSDDDSHNSYHGTNQSNAGGESRYDSLPLQRVSRNRNRNSNSSSHSSRLLGKKRTATQLDFNDGDELDDTQDVTTDPVNLSQLPRGRTIFVGQSPTKYRKSQQKTYEGRRLFSAEEKRAIREGARELGLGKWAKIKELYKIILKDRTSQQIKDCYRTMKKRGELDG